MGQSYGVDQEKDETMMFCEDYCKLNHITIGRWLQGIGSYSWIVYTPQEKTVFSTYASLYEFNKIPFGLVNALDTFQCLMEIALAGLTQVCCRLTLMMC